MSANTEISPHAGARFGFPDLGNFWTAANMLTLSRVVVIPPIAWLVYRGGPMSWLLGLIGFIILTDFLDGRVARLTNTVTEWGKVLDPIADKLAAAAICGALAFREIEPRLALWFLILVVVRDSVIAVGGVIQTRKLGYVMMALMSGKVAVNLLALVVVAVLLGLAEQVVQILTWITTAVLLYSLVRYLQRFREVMLHGPDVRVDARHNVVKNSGVRSWNSEGGNL